MKVPTNILDALRSAATDGQHLRLTGPRMTPKLYQRVNEVIEGAGGRWDGVVQAHVFAGDAAEAIAPVLASGHVTTIREARQASQYFPTPPAVVSRLVELAAVECGMEALEPSAGRGSIAFALAEAGALVDCYELDEDNYRHLLDHRPDEGPHIGVTRADFLAVPPNPIYDRVVMNPPFTKGADVAHVTHALRFLKPDGLLVTVMSWGVTYGGAEVAKFRALVEQQGGTAEAVPEGAFAESGTDVATILVTIPATQPGVAAPTVWPRREVPTNQPPAVAHEDPAALAAEITKLLRNAADRFEAVATALAPRATVATLPTQRKNARPSEHAEQLSFDALDEAS